MTDQTATFGVSWREDNQVTHMGGADLRGVCLARKPTHALYILQPYFALVKSYLYACTNTLQSLDGGGDRLQKNAPGSVKLSESVQPIIALKDLN